MDIDTLDDEGGGGEEGAPAWMATFSDLATLLLTFFVLLLSFANTDVVEFKEMLGSVREAFGVQFRVSGDFEGLSDSPITVGEMPPGALEFVSETSSEQARELEEALRERGLLDRVEVTHDREGVSVRVRDAVLFDTGEATLRPEGATFLCELAEIIASDLGADGVIVEGHTDDRPIHTERFPTNWELSTARATTVLRHLLSEAEVEAARLSASGFADTRPLSPNADDASRAANRRVEFVIVARRTESGEVRRTEVRDETDASLD